MPGTNLPREEARQRAATVATESYVVELDLSGDSTQRFTSTTTLSFSAVPGASTFVDLVDGELSSIRSEEHTSELQSRFDLVCRLLLEKKKRGRLGSWQDSCEGTRG